MTARAPGAPDARDLPRWAASFAAVLGLHGLLMAGLLAHPPATGEPGEALPAVMVDMAPPPAAPTVAPSPTPPSEAVPEAALPDPVLDTPPDIPEPDVVSPQPAVTAEIPPPQPAPGLPPDPDLKPPPVVPEKAVVALPMPLPRAAPPPPKPVVEKAAVKKPPKPVQAKRGERQEATRPPAQQAGAQTTASIPTQSSGSSASRSSWQGALVAHLRRNLRPQGGETGAASVRFSVDRGGRVLGASLVGSAGSSTLDAEALAVFRRAQPLPAPPADVGGTSFTFTIPIRFTTR